MKKMLVVDGNSILNRAYYGIRPLTNKNGLYTHAVYGMINIISRYFESVAPDYCVVAFDLKSPTFRHNMYAQYKANRKGMPEELAVQLPYAKKCMSALGYRVVTCEGYEADDILGTVSKYAADSGIHAYILTGDRDSLQLIDENVSVLLVKTKETIEFDRNVFYGTYGIYPDAFVDVKALMGDSSDNIPGVAGIGEKTAFKLISDFDSLDRLYDEYQSSGLTASVKQKLESGREMAYISRKLSLIDREAPIEKDMSFYEYNGADKNALFELFSELEFVALIKKFGLEDMNAQTKTASDTIVQNIEYSILNEEFTVEYFSGKEAALAYGGREVYLFDGKTVGRIELSEPVADKKAELLKNISVICHDYKLIYKAMKEKGIELGKCRFDTMLAAYVLNSNRNKYDLEDIQISYLGVSDASFGGTVGIYKLYECLEALVAEQNCEPLLYDIEMPLAKVLADMEMTGFRIDVNGIVEYGEELAQTAEQLKLRIYSLAGEEFNINSPKQLGEMLFEKMGLPASKKTKTGYSTDAETLQKLISKHEIIEDILDYRQVTKLKSTYAEGLAKAADENGRIHSAFNQTGTATGRLSSAEPNLQNIPVKTAMGRRFRKYFVPKNEDYVIVGADYSQIELRLLAHISSDENMREAFLSGEDIHATTASAVFGVDRSQITPELRKRAKAVNFGIVYGIGEHSLSEDLHISRAEAKQYIQSYLAGFPKVSEYLDGIKQRARQDGYVTTEFGRKRYIPELAATNKNIQHFGERVAMNSPIQGTAADIIKIAMIEVAHRLEKEGLDARLILQVHDELLLEAHKSCAEKAKEILIDCMENVVKFSVPLSVDASIGTTWYDAK